MSSKKWKLDIMVPNHHPSTREGEKMKEREKEGKKRERNKVGMCPLGC